MKLRRGSSTTSRKGPSPATITFITLVLISAIISSAAFNRRQLGILGKATTLARDAVSPLQAGARDIGAPIGQLVSGVINYSSLQAQNQRLRQQLAKESSFAKAQNSNSVYLEALSRLENIPFAQAIPKVFCQAVERGNSNYRLSIVIDKGTNNGVADGMAVVDASGLIGIVDSVQSNYADVLLLVDRSSNVGVNIITSSGYVGAIVSGAGSLNSFSVSGVGPDSSIRIGDLVVTSGQFGAIFPANIPVGIVKNASYDPGDLQESLSITPLGNFHSLDYLAVLQWLPQP